MDKHVTILGVLYLVFSLLGVMAALIVFTVLTGSGLLSGDFEAIAITSGIGTVIAFFILLLSVPGVIGGIGLLKRYSWARILGLILGAFNLLNIPFGTALGIYTFWVLTDAEAVRMFRH